MRIKLVPIAVVVVACCLSNSTWLFADLPKPTSLEEPSANGALADDQPMTVAGELDAIKALSKQLDRRIRRLELLLEFDRAVRVRSAALGSWQQLQIQRDTLVDFSERDAPLRAKYFEARDEVNRILQRLGNLDQ
jgi:hypothetical protein